MKAFGVLKMVFVTSPLHSLSRAPSFFSRLCDMSGTEVEEVNEKKECQYQVSAASKFVHL